MAKKQWTQSVASQWGLFLPPARPSLSELACIEQYILKLKQYNSNLKVAILGSTPEYRDLCQTTNTDYQCIEYSRDNFTVLGRYMLHPDDANRLIVSDWRDMQFKEKFDVFVGDLFTCVVPVADHELLYKNIRAHCAKDAVVLVKVPLRSNDQRQSHQQIFARYRKELSYLNPFSAVWREVLLADYDFVADTMDCQTSLRKLTESYHKGIITQYEWQEFKKCWDALGDFKMNVPRKKDFLKTLEKYFLVKKIMVGNDRYAKDIPIVVAQH